MSSPSSPAVPGRGRRVRNLLVDSPNSLGARARRWRWEVFTELFPDVAQMRVLDLGGTVDSWSRAPVRPAHVTVVNLTEPGETDDDWLIPVYGDACTASAVLAAAGLPTRYDLVFSNSLIEHVGGHAARLALAREVRAAAPYYWVQTPYRYFPLEPHWLFPFMQFLPVRARTGIALRWPLQHTRAASRAEAEESVQWTELIGITELAGYFPGSRILHDRALGLVKSIIAAQHP